MVLMGGRVLRWRSEIPPQGCRFTSSVHDQPTRDHGIVPIYNNFVVLHIGCDLLAQASVSGLHLISSAFITYRVAAVWRGCQSSSGGILALFNYAPYVFFPNDNPVQKQGCVLRAWWWSFCVPIRSRPDQVNRLLPR